MAIVINIYYTGVNGNARKFAEEMTSTGIVDEIRAEEGNLKYEYYFPMNDGETVLLIDSWINQEAIDKHHASPMMKKIIGEDEYATQSVAGLVQGLESAGLTNVKANKISVNFAGGTHAAIEVSGEVSGVAVYEKIVCYKKSKYVAAIAFASYVDDTTDEMLNYFYAL